MFMTNQAKSLLLITPSLLNSWGYIYYCGEYVFESENDNICLEDKITLKQEQAYQDFLKVLNREKTETTPAMQRGIDFENDCYTNKNNVCYDIVHNGAFQLVGKKEVNIDNLDFLMYGRLDVLKGGVIYDIKRVSKYNVKKYSHSYQHRFYLDLFDSAYKFTYLIYDGVKLHMEDYYREQCEDTKEVIKQFIKFLKSKDLFNLYVNKWRS